MKIKFFNHLIVRTAALPYTQELDEQHLLTLWRDPLIREGIFLASRPLYDEIIRFLEKERTEDNADIQQKKSDSKSAGSLLQSLYKYISRMSNRATPFGIFSGVTHLEWGADTNIVLNNRFRRQITPDAEMSLQIAKRMEEENPDAQYRINNTLYRQGNEYRFISYTVTEGERFYQLTSLKNNEVLEYLIEDMRDFALSRTQIIALSGYETDEFLPFLNQLIDIQFLKYAHQPGIGLAFPEFILQSNHNATSGNSENSHLSGLSATIVMPNPKEIVSEDNTTIFTNNQKFKRRTKTVTLNPDLKQIIEKFEVINHSAVSSDNCQSVKSVSNNQSVNQVNNYIDQYQALETDVADFLGSKLANTFHVTRFNQLDHAVLSSNIQHKLEKAIKLLNNLNRHEPNPRLERFKKDFQDKYQERSVSLLELFDTDIGLQYGKLYEKATLFTEGLEDASFGNGQPRQYQPLDLELLKVLTEAFHDAEYTFVIPDNFVAERPMDQLPHTMSVTFQAFDNGNILLEQVSGTGAIGLLSRFASGSEEISGLASEMTKEEALANPDALYAEIVHLPEERSMNIMAHPPFWTYEIQYIDHANGNHVIHLADLDVLLVGDTFHLYSRKHQKEIIPRLSSAYNYSRSQHPIYTFLCDIQHQQTNNILIFKWGELARDQVFFPRVVTKLGVILQRATWRFSVAILSTFNIAGQSFEQLKEILADFRSYWMLPVQFLIVKGDNELLIDCENDISLRVLFKEISKKTSELILKECLHQEWNTVVKDGLKNSYAHQFVAPFSISNLINKPKINSVSTQLKREFLPGSEWLYIKFFLSENSVQPILLQLYQLLEGLSVTTTEPRLINKWFFIRYKEGGNHIRVRIELSDPFYFQQVYFAIMTEMETAIQDRVISSVQLDTYVREIERYSPEKMEMAEELFAIDSRFCCQTFDLLKQNYMDKDWLLIFWPVMDYLQRMSSDKSLQLKFAERQLAYFLREFDDKAVKVQIDQLNRKYRNEVEQLPLQYRDLLEARKIAVDSALNNKNISWDDRFSGSMIHMLLNRYFNTQQRLHECLLYGFIVKALKTDIARSSPHSKNNKQPS